MNGFGPPLRQASTGMMQKTSIAAPWFMIPGDDLRRAYQRPRYHDRSHITSFIRECRDLAKPSSSPPTS